MPFMGKTNIMKQTLALVLVFVLETKLYLQIILEEHCTQSILLMFSRAS
jgi:hypothetical protein